MTAPSRRWPSRTGSAIDPGVAEVVGSDKRLVLRYVELKSDHRGPA
jgi:hypothetical protein